MPTKVCYTCHIEKDLSEFNMSKRHKDGHDNRCRACMKAYNKEFRNNNKKSVKIYNNKLIQIYKTRNYESERGITSKVCPKCNTEKDISEFNKSNTRKDVYSAYCKECKKIYYMNDRKLILQKRKSHYQEKFEEIREYKKQYHKNNKERLSKKYKLWKDANEDHIKNYKSQYRQSKVIAKTFINRLTVAEHPIADDEGYLQVKCTYCDRYFYPTNIQLTVRLNILEYDYTSGEGRMYCSGNCKKSCPIYGRKKIPKGYKPATSREVQPELRKMRFQLDDYECQKCGARIDDAELHCHHYTGTMQNPIESADLDNTVTVCKKCHKWVHTQEGCRYFEMRCGGKK